MPTIRPSGSATLRVSGKEVRLTNLDKLFWPDLLKPLLLGGGRVNLGTYL